MTLLLYCIKYYCIILNYDHGFLFVVISE